jgi:hypothetical protein
MLSTLLFKWITNSRLVHQLTEQCGCIATGNAIRSAVLRVASSAVHFTVRCVATGNAVRSAVLCVASNALHFTVRCVATGNAVRSAVLCVSSSAVHFTVRCVAAGSAVGSAVLGGASTAVLFTVRCVATGNAVRSAVLFAASNAVHFTVRCVALSAAAYLCEPFPVYSSSPSANKVRSRQDNFLCQPSAVPSSYIAGTHIHVSMFLITPLLLKSLSTVRSIQI